eukprot:6461461-Amphidinium_carterae.2
MTQLQLDSDTPHFLAVRSWRERACEACAAHNMPFAVLVVTCLLAWLHGALAQLRPPCVPLDVARSSKTSHKMSLSEARFCKVDNQVVADAVMWTVLRWCAMSIQLHWGAVQKLSYCFVRPL